ncbi:Alkaline phosphatase placental [Fasciola hepatica]|uniref:alkaline phosphatase n=1 Tax=Fasciola hepatica TaxID=6192 RepID=A0A2H1BRM0_FASHE|nr:Alkaline phosphatase placental [Fasciola hepatica]
MGYILKSHFISGVRTTSVVICNDISSFCRIALTETLAFEGAVNAAVNLTDPQETLIVVTADHSHAYHVVGYASRTRSVLDVDDTQKGDDDMSYLISDYANGPGAVKDQPRGDPLNRGDLMDSNYKQQALVPLKDSTHEAEDVPLYATGAYSHLFRRSTDNTYVAYATMFALCLGPYGDAVHCNRGDRIGTGPSQNTLLVLSIILAYFAVRR